MEVTRVTNKTSQICQYRVCPPVASMQGTQRRRILLMSLAICSWGILHSSCRAAPKAWSVLGRGTLSYTLAENVPNMLDWRQVRGSSRPVEMIHIVLLQELLYYPRPMRSCIVILQHYVVLLNKRQNNRLWHFIDVALAYQSSVKHKQLCTGRTDMPPHTIRLPPPYRSCSTMAQFAYLSPLRRQTRRRVSSISSRNRDSSVKSTVAHCWLVHRRFCLVHASLVCLCLWESGTPT